MFIYTLAQDAANATGRTLEGNAIARPGRSKKIQRRSSVVGNTCKGGLLCLRESNACRIKSRGGPL